jgi:hypothetical protein
MKRVRAWARRHPWRVGSVLITGSAVLTFGLIYFAPQDLLINTSVDEPLPTASANSDSASMATSHRPTIAHPSIRRLGRFSSGEHTTSGTAVLLRLSDGTRFVRLEDLATSNGPAVRVWLSSAAAPTSNEAVEKGRALDLGGLKANHGNQNYADPARAGLSRYRSVVLWCARFKVVFGSAPLTG